MRGTLPLWLALVWACADDEKAGTTDTAGGVTPSDADADTDADADADADTDTLQPPCTAEVETVTPGNNTEATVDTTIVATFSEAITPSDPYAIRLTAGASGSIAGTTDLAPDGLSATFVPTNPLAYDTPHNLAVEVCQSAVQGGFRTLPEPIDPTTLPGRTFGVLYDDIVFVEPGNTALLTLDLDYILVQLASVDLVSQTIDAVAATADILGATITPDCAAAVTAPTSDFSTNPRFQVGPADLSFPYNDGSVTIEAFELSGQFDAAVSKIEDVRIYGLFDPEQVLPGVSCALAAPLVQGTCVPCPSGTASCLVIEAEAAEAAYLPSVDVMGTCGI